MKNWLFSTFSYFIHWVVQLQYLINIYLMVKLYMRAPKCIVKHDLKIYNTLFLKVRVSLRNLSKYNRIVFLIVFIIYEISVTIHDFYYGVSAVNVQEQ